MESENTSLLEDIRHNGKIAHLVKKSRKAYKCSECGLPTKAGEPYYIITHGGAGLRDIKFPDRVHVGDCLYSSMGFGKEEK